MTQQSFRILSIDGGGVRGYLSAAILANIEERLNAITKEEVPLGLRFDLIAGTSVGGLLALGLARGHSAVELRNLLLSLIPKIFGNDNRRWLLSRLIRPSYNAHVLQEELEEFFQKSTLRDLECDACITSLSLFDAKPCLHKTDYFERNTGRLDERLVDVAMATAAAPTYFPAHSSKYSENLIDGGLVANNPSVVALVDALQFDRPSKRGIDTPQLDVKNNSGPVLVSVGTGQPGPLPYNHKCLIHGGLLNWARPIHEVFLLGQSQLAHHQAKFLVGPDRYLRIDPLLNVSVKLDDAKRFRELRNKADIDAETERFLTTWFSE